MAAIWTKPAALPATSFANVLQNAIWDTYGKELVGTSVTMGSYLVPVSGVNVDGRRPKIIRCSAGAPFTDTYWTLVNGFLKANGQALDSTVTQSPGSLTLTPVNAATGLGTGTFTSSGIGGVIGKRYLSFETVSDPRTGEILVIVTPLATAFATAAKATAGAIAGSGPGILHSVLITTTGDADNVWTSLYDHATDPAAPAAVVANIPPRNQETLVLGPGSDTGRIYHFNVPFQNGLYYSGIGNVAAATNGPAITVLYSI